ncbi:molybdopterin-binding protein [Leifsonia sp. F6_8S_P_1B]|uniref:Molybdopterin molybdenumtransferase n=1 Tax=Leifsonia williamsii TaxID=3035919 RepID=A0ABT8K7A0_9MICO|nr:molybdopterin-binding protein [Leifsonia williamsii]MDN4613264.1 molybdopterin-binding protein [Leifsonia williamsii]
MKSWQDARELAYEVGRRHPARTLNVPLGRAAGLRLAADLRAERSVPRFDNSAMDGWAVAGDGPWREGEPVLAGMAPGIVPLTPGEARPIATGAPVPPGTSTVLRAEEGILESGPDGMLVDTIAPLDAGRDIRRCGEEAESGDVLLERGARLTPPAIGLLAAAGIASVDVLAPPLITAIATGDELAGPEAGPGQVTDALSPLMPSLLSSLGGRCATAVRALDHADDVAAAIARARTGLLISSGGTAHGPADPVREALARLDARLVIDGVALRPGSSVLLAELPDGRVLLALPGNPLAAVVDLLLLGWPLLCGALGTPLAPLPPCPLPLGELPRHGAKAIACVREEGALVAVPHQRSGMLRGIATATHLVLTENADAHLLRLPWE